MEDKSFLDAVLGLIVGAAIIFSALFNIFSIAPNLSTILDKIEAIELRLESHKSNEECLNCWKKKEK